MSLSGVSVDDSCINEFTNFKLRNTAKYIIYKINGLENKQERKEIVIEKQSAPDATYEDLVAEFPKNECRYAVFSFTYDTEGGKRNKCLFIFWAPDTAKVFNKMTYAASKDALKKKLQGVGVEIQANCISNLEYQAVLEKCLSMSYI
eukprot:GEZU01039065.1.p2 GENE.GEZU01039065.1~~GEZU01039065.1.p2  ORF type:complete len:147 (+),score=61.89 GEZU01039065.1:282-722(+)